MLNRLLEKLEQKKALVSDGAWVTILQSVGLQAGECPEELNISHPDKVKSIAAVKAAKAICDSPVIVTMTFEKGKQGYRTMMGITIEHAVNELTEAGIDLLGTNCGNGIDQVVEIISTMRRFTNKYLVCHLNARILG